MGVKKNLQDDMKAALKDREAGRRRLSVIRLALSEIKNAEINKGAELTDDEILEVLSREVKKQRDSIADYSQAGQQDRVKEIEEEISILSEYLPRQLTEEEIEEVIRETIAQVNADGLSDMGKVMGAVMPKIKGKADGKLVNKKVRELLELKA